MAACYPTYHPVPAAFLERMNEVFEDIRSLYDTGAPLFTKARLRDFLEQVDKYEKGELENNEMVITSITGRPARITLQRQPDVQLRSGGILRSSSQASIRYHPIQDLISEAATGPWDLRTAYLTILPQFRCEMIENGVVEDDPGRNNPYSAAELGNILNTKKTEWQETPQYAALKAIFASNKAVLSGARKVIGIGLGPLVYGSETHDGYNHSLMQHALLLSLRELIVENGGSAGEVRCFAQDPVLFPAATTALENAGITVLDDPRAFLETDGATILVSVSPDIPVKQIVADIARPAAIMWMQSIGELERGILTTDPTSSRVEAILDEEYIDTGFPFYEPFRGVSIYVRKPVAKNQD